MGTQRIQLDGSPTEIDQAIVADEACAEDGRIEWSRKTYFILLPKYRPNLPVCQLTFFPHMTIHPLGQQSVIMRTNGLRTVDF